MVTIVIPISRKDFLKELFESLNNLYCDPATVSLLTYVDGDLTLFEKARNYTVASKFHQRLCVFRAKGLPNTGHIRSRRKRISDIHNELKTALTVNDPIEDEFVLLVEDDTLIPPDTLDILLSDFKRFPYAGIISGIELGRWGYNYIGAWQTDNIHDPSRIVSLPKLDDGLYHVHATGLYCCLVRKENYLNQIFQPFDDILGPDVDFGFNLSAMGLKNYSDYRVKCTHLDVKKRVDYSDPVVQIEYTRDEDRKWQLEAHQTEIPTILPAVNEIDPSSSMNKKRQRENKS